METYSAAGFEWDEATQKWRGLLTAPKGKKGLSAVGSAVYLQDPSSEVLCLAYDLKDGAGTRQWLPGMPLPPDLLAYMATFDPDAPASYDQAGIIEAHNSMFELRAYIEILHTRFGWPRIHLRQLRCSMAKARAYSLPGKLEHVGKVLQLDVQKDAKGKKLLDRFSIPRTPTKSDPRRRILPAEDPAQAAELYSYNRTDIVAEAGVSARCPDLIPQELEYWLADQACNWRGIGVDVPSVQGCIAVLEQALTRYNGELYRITGGQVARASEVQQLTDWLASYGVRMSALDEEAINEQLARMAPHPPGGLSLARRALEIRLLVASASVKKVYAMARMAARGDRLHDLYIYHGARTGRDTHADVQPGNLPKAGPRIRWCGDVACERPFGAHADACPWCGASAAFASKPDDWNAEAVEHALEIVRCGNLDLVEMFFGDALLTLAGCIRGLLVAAPGHDLICSDYSSIEAVVTAMLSGEEWRIEAFRNREDIYLRGASAITGTPYEEYLAYAEREGKKHPDRQKIGKVSELACLSHETKVLTKRGLLGVLDVTLTDELWDGVEWVKHQGVIAKGVRPTISVDGAWMTPDHEVMTPHGWAAASELNSNALCLTQSLANASAALPSSVQAGRPPIKERLTYSASAAKAPMRSQCTTYCAEKARNAINAPKSLRRRIAKCITAGRTSWKTVSTAAGCSTDFRPLAPGATTRRLSNTPATAAEVLQFSKSGEKIEARFWRTFKLAPVGTTLIWKWIGGIMKKVTSQETSSSSPSKRTTQTVAPSKKCNNESLNLKPVFDIAHAGPRNRFTIATDSGYLIVHNCGFMGWLSAWRNFDKSDNYTDDEVKQKITAWREASPKIVEFAGGQLRGKPWAPDRMELFGLEGAFIKAVLNPGQVVTVAGLEFQLLGETHEHNGAIVTRAGTALFVKLLSGRRLTYHEPCLTPTKRFDSGPATYAISYKTWNTNQNMGPTGWVSMGTFAGRLIENIVQSTARDVMSNAVVNLEKAGYPVVLRVHDELAAEVPKGFGSIEEFERIMADLPDWCKDWPIRASGGWSGQRYRKE